MALTAIDALNRVEEKISRVELQVTGLRGVLLKGEIVRWGQSLPLTEEGREVRERLLKDDLLSLADLQARKGILQMATSGD